MDLICMMIINSGDCFCFSFSIYKNILTDKRHKLTTANLKKIVTVRMFFTRGGIASCAEDTDDSLRPTTAFH